MRKIISIIKEAPKERSLWEFHLVLCEFDNGTQMKVCMYPEEYEFELMKEKILSKNPKIAKDIEKMLELFKEHQLKCEARNECED